MATQTHPETAQIFEFPQRRSVKAAGRSMQSTPQLDVPPHDLVEVAFGSGWYHDAAVQEAERIRKN